MSENILSFKGTMSDIIDLFYSQMSMDTCMKSLNFDSWVVQ